MKTKCKIGDLGQVVTGKTPSTSKREYYGHEYPFITPSDITGSFHVTPATYLSSEGARLLNKIMIPAKSVCYTCIASIGKICVTKEDSFTNQQINSIIVDEEKNDFRYIYYLLKFYTNHIKAIATGAATPIVNKERFSNVEVSVHKLDKQKRIADILSAYDDLIENNQKQIRLQEEAAMLLYKEWFVNLRFPGYENTKIVDGVPEGWSRKKLIDIADITMGQSPKSEYYNDRQQGLPFHQGVTNYGYRFVIDETYSTNYTRIAEAGSILFSVRAPVGRMNITKNKIVIGRGLAAINHREGLQSFLFYMLKNRFYKDDLIGNGAIYASITKSALNSQEFLIPSDNLANKFNSVVKSIDQQITNADRQIILLKQARDKLLSKLMNGEIEI